MKKISLLNENTIDPLHKQKAEKAFISFNQVIKFLDIAKNHLDIMYNPFKENPDISKEEIIKFRDALRRFRDKSVSNFNNFKIALFKTLVLLDDFTFDTQTNKLTKSLISTVDVLENNVNEFVELFDNLEDKDFIKNVLEIMDTIFNLIDQIKDTIKNRFKDHIQKNILGITWADMLGKKLNLELYKKEPFIMELNNKKDK